MDRIPLSALQAGLENQRIRVRVSRLCHHRGGLGDGDIKEIRMVLVDEEGASIYAIIPRIFVAQNIDGIQETCVYDLASFKVTAREVFLNPVQNPLVLMFRELTTAQLVFHHVDEFPEWTYRLTSFVDLPTPGHATREFVDVIGVIRGISDIAILDLPGRNVQASRRNLLLADESGNEMKLTLWGEAAFRFNAQVIRFLADDESAVAIFVGMNVHTFEGSKELAGDSACRWYINVDIKEINILRAQVQSSFQQIMLLPDPVQVNLRAPIDGRYPIRPLSLILNTDFYQNQDSMFRCTVKVWRLTPGRPWWRLSCTHCGRRATPTAASSPSWRAGYKCSDTTCLNTDATLEYCLHLLCFDNTGEAEFTLFGRLANDIVGIPVQNLIRNNSQGAMSAANLQVMHIPPELAEISAWKYKLLFRVSADDFQGGWASFHVHGVEARYPPNFF